MITDLEDRIDQLKEHWDAEISGRQLTIDQSIPSEQIDPLFSDVASLREIFSGRNLILELEYESGAFEYRLIWETSGNIISRQEVDNGADPDRLFSEEDAQESIDRVRENRISDYEELKSTVKALIGTGHVDCTAQYRILGEHIDRYVEEAVDAEFRVTYYFEASAIETKIETLGVADVKEYFFTAHGKRLFLIRDFESVMFGTEVGIFPPREVGDSQFQSFVSRQSDVEDQFNRIGQECAIDYFSERYIPPKYIEFDFTPDTRTSNTIQELLRPFRLWFCILGTSNIARKTNDGWQIRINGRRVIESTITIDEVEKEPVIRELDVDTEPVPITEELVVEFSELFEWIYTSKTTDRITVFRNIVTLYSTTLSGALREIYEISESVESNFQFYIQDSIEEFVGVQQDVSEYVFETHREMADIRRGLSNNLNQDSFRVFIFAVISWVGIITQLNRIAEIRFALALSLIPVCIYVALGMRTTYSLSQQFQSIEDGKEQYYSMYESRIDERVMTKIRDADGSKNMKLQFRYDLYIYYILFSLLLLISIYAIVDLTILNGPLTALVESLSSA